MPKSQAGSDNTACIVSFSKASSLEFHSNFLGSQDGWERGIVAFFSLALFPISFPWRHPGAPASVDVLLGVDGGG